MPMLEKPKAGNSNSVPWKPLNILLFLFFFSFFILSFHYLFFFQFIPCLFIFILTYHTPWYNIISDHSCKVKEGTAVVFSNSIPHRFRKISNLTDSNQKRTFINFFVVNPDRKLSYPTAFCTKIYVRMCLQR